MKKKGYLIGSELKANDIFELSSPGNRDNCYEPYFRLRDTFQKKEIELDTYDLMLSDEKPLFLIEQNIQKNHVGNAPIYVLLWETQAIWPLNGDASNFGKYRKVFTWRDDLVDGERFIKIHFPNPLSSSPVDGYTNRPLLTCMIAGNKSVIKSDSRELYSERVKVIRWFESNAPKDFALYGVGWDLPMARSGLMGKVSDRISSYVSQFIELHPFPSYHGRVNHKRDVLRSARFSICYENVRDLPGYITEKIFDSFFSGCVPVYWGASNITEYIPKKCFIDRRDFNDISEVYLFMKNMKEDQYLSYQTNIASFLNSDAVIPFGSEEFAETIVKTIVKDLESIY